MKEEVRKLWKLCFNDSKEFVDLYFDKRYKDDINLTVVEDGQVVSALQMVPYTLTYYGRLLPVSYISGASTHPDFRSQGIMRTLLDQSHRSMYQNGVLISTLIPAEEWLFGYYERGGYVPAFYYSSRFVDAADLHCSSSLQIDEVFSVQKDTYSYFSRKMSERNCCIQHTEEDLSVVMADLHLSRGKVFLARQKQQTVGLLFCIPSDGALRVTESLADSETILESLLRTASVQMNCDRLNLSYYAAKGTKPKGMIRIINADLLLRLYAQRHPETSLVIQLSDKNIPQNNHIYILENGTSRCSASLEGTVPVRMDIGQLARFFFEQECACMSLMLD